MMDHVCRNAKYKTLDKAGKNVNLILMATILCGCIDLCIDPRYQVSLCDSTYPQRCKGGELTVLYYLFLMGKFPKRNTFHHRSIRKWTARSILESLREKER
eukprot:g25735.t1